MPRIIDSENSRQYDSVSADFSEFILLKQQIDELSKRQTEIKTRLSKIVEELGEEDDKGHLWFELPEEIEGYVAMQRQKRISQRLDEETAETVLKDRGLYDRCFRMMPVLDEDEVMACLYEGIITEADVDAMFPKTINWAFVPSKR